jgi:hypothetical protein
MSAIRDTSAWTKFATEDLEEKLIVLRQLIESGMLTDRSAEHQLIEIGMTEGELAKLHGG